MPPTPEKWLEQFVVNLLKQHPEIEQVYVLGHQARGPQGQKPNFSLLFYAGYDRALDLMTSLARCETELRPMDGIVHLYVENYGATFCGIWGGALIPNGLNCRWVEGLDYRLWFQTARHARSLEERLRLPLERRRKQRRQNFDAIQGNFGDELEPLFPVEQLVFDSAQQNQLRRERRENNDRRRDLENLLPLLEE